MTTIAPPSSSTAYRVTLSGRESIQNVRAMSGEVVSALEQGERRVEVDCSGWNQLDLRILSTLIRCAKACVEFGADFELLNVHEHVRADLRQLRLGERVGLVS